MIKLKLFSPDMKFLSSVSSPPCGPWDIAVVNDKEAVVTTDDKTLAILDISERQLSIKRSVQVDTNVLGISSLKSKLLVTCPNTEPPSVKLIDQTGRVYWSVSTDQQGRQLFKYPEYVCCHDDDGTSSVIVTDWKKNTLTLLKAETGEVVTIHQQEKDKEPRDVTTDTDGNIYVCYWSTHEVSVLTGDLTKVKTLLTKRDDLCHGPRAIVYEETRRQLFVSYWVYGSIDCFQLS